MKVFIVFSICISLVWACENLAKLEACNRPDGDCSCQAGLSCVLTKKVILDGRVTDVKQCMPEDEVIIVETADFDDKGQAGPALLAKRSNWLFSKCSATADCAQNLCCPPGIKICLPKIPENGLCNFDEYIQCGCQEGLVCKPTTNINLVPGTINLGLKQCVRN